MSIQSLEFPLLPSTADIFRLDLKSRILIAEGVPLLPPAIFSLIQSIFSDHPTKKRIKLEPAAGGKIIFKENKIGPEGAAALVKALKTAGLVNKICLINNPLGYNGAITLLPLLVRNQVRVFSLKNASVGDIGAIALAEGLEGNTSLEKLMLSGNSITHLGIAPLAKALLNCSVKKVFLGDNPLGDEGAIALAPLLQENRITHLNLQNTSIGDSGASALAKARMTTFLILKNNAISFDTRNLISHSKIWI